MRKLFIILIMGVFILSISCAKKDADNNSQDYFSKADLLKYGLNEKSEMNPREQFEIQLKEFHDFSREFFSVWDNHIEATTPLLKKFNNKDTILDDKIMYSGMLREKYEKFSDDIKQITPPPEAAKAYQYALNAISKRILFFKEFEKGTSIYQLTEIENEAYLYETLFWEEIDNIYNHFDEISDQLGISGDSEFFSTI